MVTGSPLGFLTILGRAHNYQLPTIIPFVAEYVISLRSVIV